MKKWLLIAFLLAASSVWAQGWPSIGVLPDNGPTLPSTCNVGQIYFQTVTGGGGIGLYQCLSSNTWTKFGTGGLTVAGATGDDQINSGSSTLAAGHLNDGHPVAGYMNLSEPLSMGAGHPLTETEVVGSTGVTQYLLCSLDSTGAVVTSGANATGVYGICQTTQTVGQNVEVAKDPSDTLAVAGGAITINDLVGTGTTAGRVYDLGVVNSNGVANNVQVIGRATTAGTTGNPFSLAWYGPGHYGTLVVAAGVAQSVCSDNGCTQLNSKPACADTSGSGTVQSCATSPTFVPAAGAWVIYTTTTANTGDVTVNVNSLGAKHIRKNLGAAVLDSGDLPANVNVPLYYDGTYWEIQTVANASAGLSNVAMPSAEFASSITGSVETVTKQNQNASYFWKSLPSSTQTPFFVAATTCQGAAGASTTCTLNSPTIAGHLLVINVISGDSITSATDSASNSYTDAGGDTNYTHQVVYYHANIGAGVTSVTVNFGASLHLSAMVVTEWGNVALTSPLDTANATDFSACGPPASLSPVTTGTANDLIISSAATPAGMTYVAGVGYSLAGTVTTSDNGSSTASQWVAVGATGTYTPTISCSGHSQQSVTVAFKGLSSPATQQPGFYPAFVADFTSIAIGPIYNHAGTFQNVSPHFVSDTCTLGTSCAVTLTGNAVFTSSSTYSCVAQDDTGANATAISYSSGSAFTITGTGSDVIRYICVGN